MKLAHRAALSLALGFAFTSLPAAAQSGSAVFLARITPSAGVSEPVRGLPFYLLRKSFSDIQREANASIPQLDFNRFVDSLSVSTELKAWMKKHQTVALNGETFRKMLTPDDILNIPEFWKAYFDENTSGVNLGFPTRKFKESDHTRNPQKYQRELDAYNDKVRKYLAANPDSTDSMDIELEPIDQERRWGDMVAARAGKVKSLALDLAQSRYLAAQTQTDANGRGAFSGVAPGKYWISSLNIEAQVGDTRERWDVAVAVQSGMVTRVTLSNFDAEPATKSAS